MRKIINSLRMLLIGIMSACDFNMSNTEVQKIFENKVLPDFHTVSWRGKNIHYAEIKKVSSPAIIFVHGSPGSWSNFAGYMAESELVNQAHLISIDRLGFGKSSPERAELRLENHSEAIYAIIKKNVQGPCILVGHSYGGAVIARLALDHPDRIKGLIFLAPAIDAESEEIYWYNHLGKNFLIRQLLSQNLINSNDEIVALKKELMDLQPLWHKLQVNVLGIHGKKDSLVPIAHTLFLENLLKEKRKYAEFYYPSDMGHFFIWSNKDMVVKRISDFLLKTQQE